MQKKKKNVKRVVSARKLRVSITILDYLKEGFIANTNLSHYGDVSSHPSCTAWKYY